MADTDNNSERTATARDQSFEQAPKKISNATWIGAAIALLIIIIGAVLIGIFFSAGQMDANSNTPTSESRAKP